MTLHVFVQMENLLKRVKLVKLVIVSGLVTESVKFAVK